MTLEVTSVDVKEKPINKEVQILEALHKLIGKIEELNINVKNFQIRRILISNGKWKKKKYPFYYLIIFIALVGGGFYFISNKTRPPVPPVPHMPM